MRRAAHAAGRGHRALQLLRAPGGQGGGLGSELLGAVLRRADGRPVYTATTGSARLFLHHGFTEIPTRLAPPAWAAALDPARNSRVYLRT